MYSFSQWCFLCARENNVKIEIQTLTSNEQSKIGEFSILNYNLLGCPKSICKKCYKFIQDIETFVERTSRVEQLFIELMKNKNKNIDANEIKKKYKLDDDEVIAEVEIIQQVNENVTQLGSGTIVEIYAAQNAVDDSIYHEPEATESKIISTTKETKDQNAQKPKPKILNPTILPKIENKIRIELLKCDKCNHTTSTKQAMKNHILCHIRNETLFECKMCQKKFNSKKVLKNHEAIHTTNRKIFECGICCKVLSSQTAINSHMKWYHSENRDFNCDVCNKKFATKGSFNEHVKIHSNVKQHACPICKKEYKSASTLSNHLDTHSTTEYRCSICDLKLNTKRTLKQHEKCHNNIILHTCEICGAEFKRTKTYKEHLITHTNFKPYSCQYCKKTFTNGPNARKHKREVHPQELEKEDNENKKVVKLPKIEELLSMSKANLL